MKNFKAIHFCIQEQLSDTFLWNACNWKYLNETTLQFRVSGKFKGFVRIEYNLLSGLYNVSFGNFGKYWNPKIIELDVLDINQIVNKYVI